MNKNDNTTTDIDIEEYSYEYRTIGRKRIEQMKRRKKQQELMRRFFIPCVIVVVLCVLFAGIGIRALVKRHTGKKQEAAVAYDGAVNMADRWSVSNAFMNNVEDELSYISAQVTQTVKGNRGTSLLSAITDEATVLTSSEVASENSIFIDVAEGRILAEKNATARISPASMTKILTVLVAAEHIKDLDDKVEITIDITDYSFANGCSNTGFELGEMVTVKDLFYGTILPSGADSAVALAKYVAGSHEEFVKMMNEKLAELGLADTSHFTNCVGLYDEKHYSTVYDMAVILKAACDNSFCREVLSAHTYQTSVTEQHPEGLVLSNWFLRRIEDKDIYGEVLCAKTGYVEKSGNCAASLGIGSDGKEYICVTAHSTGNGRCISDHTVLYQQFLS